MAHEVCFFHKEADMESFLQEIQDQGGRILLDGEARLPMEAAPQLLQRMNGWHNTFPLIAEGMAASGFAARNGTAIEFINCSKGTEDSVDYELGRLTLQRMADGTYDPALLALYTAMHDYIRKNYIYSKIGQFYYSHQVYRARAVRRFCGRLLRRPLEF